MIARLRLVWKDALSLVYALGDRRTPAQAKWIAAGALLYALSPVDLLPDTIPLAGWGDDVLVVPAVLALAARTLPTPVLNTARLRSQRLQRQMPWLLPALAGLLLVGAALVVWGIARLVRG